jgi:large subunit ribosomal protein L29
MSTTNELRQLSPEELRSRVTELKQRIFEMKSKLHTGVLDSTAELGKARRTVAACLTVAREAELGVVRRPKTETKTRKGKKE